MRLAMAYQKVTFAPVDVIKTEVRDFFGAQSEAREQQHDGVIAPVMCGASASGKYASDLVSSEVLRECGELVLLDNRHGGDDASGNNTLCDEVA